MRGGRGGRFGGRGGTGTSSMAYELIRDNLEDLGIESTHNGHDTDRSPPPLYPRISLPPPISSSSEDLQALYRMREFMKRAKCSPYYMSRSVEQKDIARYSDVHKRPTSSSNGLTAITAIMTKDGINYADQYFPQELLNTARAAKPSVVKEQKLKPVDMDYSNLLEMESIELNKTATAPDQAKEGGNADKGSDNEDEELGDDAAAADEFEMDDDYNVDHYADSDNDHDGGGEDGEAFF